MDMQVGGPVDPEEFAEVAFYYDLWRKLANSEGSGPYEVPDWQSGKLFLRLDYWDKVRKWPEWETLGEWGAWVIAPMPPGYFRVLHSLQHERATHRTEDIRAIFSRFIDAGKYVILRMGDSLRSDLRLKTLFMLWDDRGLNERLEVDVASQDVIELLCKEMPTLDRDSIERYLKLYILKGDTDSYAYTFPSEQPRMEILTLSFEELTVQLLEGMPENITSLVRFYEK